MPPLRNTPSGTSLIEPPAHGLPKARAELLDVLVVAMRGSAVGVEREVPVRARSTTAPVAPAENVAARAACGRPRRSSAASARSRARDSGRGSRGRASAGSADARAAPSAPSRRAATAPTSRVVERLLPEPVAGEQRARAARRPRARTRTSRSGARRSRRRAPRRGGRSPRCPRASQKRWPAPRARAQLAEVVDLAVEDDLHRAVLVGDRLVAGLEVDDREPAEAEADARRRRRTARRRSPRRRARGAGATSVMRASTSRSTGSGPTIPQIPHMSIGAATERGAGSSKFVARGRGRRASTATRGTSGRSSSASRPSRIRLRPIVKRKTPTRSDGWRYT